jgi:hypothetical protein
MSKAIQFTLDHQRRSDNLPNRIINFTIRQCIRLYFYLIFSLGSMLFFSTMYHYIILNQLLELAKLCFPILAILFGFAALLYNRSRAIQPGPSQRRSLYAAERALQATILFLLGVATGTIIATITSELKIDMTYRSGSSFLLLTYLIPIMLVLYSFCSFFFAVRAISHGVVRYVGTRQLLRKIR